MTAIITQPFRLKNLRLLKKKLDEGTDLYHLGIGRAQAWTNEALPPTPALDHYTLLDARHALFAVKKIANIANVAPRYNWTNGNTYVAWDPSDADLDSKAYYVLNTSNFNVYICLKAGSGASTVEPTGIDDDNTFGGTTGVAGTSVPQVKGDGYRWKYLYTIDTVSATRYLTTDFMPVLRNASVAANTIRGAIYNLKITSGGTGYASAPTLTIEGDGTGATATCTISGGIVNSITMTAPGSGYTYARVVVSGGSPSSAATFSPSIAPAAVGREIAGVTVTSGGTSYTNGSLALNILGDGFSAQVTATVTGGVIQASPTVNAAGYGYTEAQAVPATTTAGTAAVLKVQYSTAKGGFGYDPIIDLNAYYLMFNVVLDGAEGSGDFVPGNDYRQLSIIQNIKTPASPPLMFTDSTGIAMKKHFVNSGGTWVQDDTITGASSGAKGIVVYYDTVNRWVYYYQTSVTGWKAFTDGETLTGTGASTGVIASAGGSAGIVAEIDKYSGNVLYLENRAAVSRSTDQQEDIKLTIQL